MLKAASFIAMTRRPKLGRRHRNFTLDELLTNIESGPTGELVQGLATEFPTHAGKIDITQAPASCDEKRGKDD
jgi:hypothetical protein